MAPKSVDVPQEAAVLLACARSARDPAARSELGGLLERGIDWKRLRQCALDHGMLVILARRLADYCPGHIPPEVLDDLRSVYAVGVTDGMRKLAQTVSVLRCLADGGICAVPLKGCVLSHQAYGDIGLRASVDLDILLAQEDAERATGLLGGLGYAPALDLDRRQRLATLHFNGEWLLVRAGRGSYLDLHWRLTSSGVACDLDTDGLLVRARTVDVLGHDLPVLCREDLLLALCLHGAKHDWRTLELICALAEVAEGEPDVDWGELLETASRVGCRRRCLLGGLLAADLLGATVPKAFLDEARDDRHVSYLASRALEALFEQESEVGLIKHMRWQLRVLDGFRARMRFILHRTFGVTPEDWETISLPTGLYPLYYVLRPPRLVQKHVRRLVSPDASSG